MSVLNSVNFVVVADSTSSNRCYVFCNKIIANDPPVNSLEFTKGYASISWRTIFTAGSSSSCTQEAFQALEVACRVQVTWLAISSTPLAVNSVVPDFQSSKIKSHVYKVLLNSIYGASKDLWPSICTWSTTRQRKKETNWGPGRELLQPFSRGVLGRIHKF